MAVFRHALPITLLSLLPISFLDPVIIIGADSVINFSTGFTIKNADWYMETVILQAAVTTTKTSIISVGALYKF